MKTKNKLLIALLTGLMIKLSAFANTKQLQVIGYVGEPTATLTLSSASGEMLDPLGFILDADATNMSASSTKSRWKTTNVKATYDAAGTFDIFVYTDNGDNDGDGKDDMGLVKVVDDGTGQLIVDTTNPASVPMKFTTDMSADVTDIVDWAGDNNDTPNQPGDDIDPKYHWVFDLDTVNEDNNRIVSTLLPGSENQSLVGSLDFNFGVDIAGKPAGIYSTLVTLELVIR